MEELYDDVDVVGEFQGAAFIADYEVHTNYQTESISLNTLITGDYKVHHNMTYEKAFTLASTLLRAVGRLNPEFLKSNLHIKNFL